MSDETRRGIIRPLTPEEIAELDQDIEETFDRLLADLRGDDKS